MELNLLIVTTLEQTAGLGVQVLVARLDIESVKALADSAHRQHRRWGKLTARQPSSWQRRQ